MIEFYLVLIWIGFFLYGLKVIELNAIFQHVDVCTISSSCIAHFILEPIICPTTAMYN
jgi:hypothetical protein